MSSSRPIRKHSSAICDGLCHCNNCQYLENGGVVFVENSGHVCKCGEFFLATQCWVNNIPCYKCYAVLAKAKKDAEQQQTKGMFIIHFLFHLYINVNSLFFVVCCF